MACDVARHDYAWSKHIVTVFLARQITIKNVQVQLTVKGKTTPDSYTATPKSRDDNARPHRARIVQHVLQQEAVQTIPWPAMSPDMNPIEHVWDFIGRKINL
jgi:transposase